ncbi:Crp/Fnr family transcriptional regulator [Tenacibaculum maritimum]|uniref:Putative transcriptional regulator, Crp/Fnr family n=2 Tax=Tenacibaculum maritimum TaxID=107401 RepID=A0A2H1E9I0_9FLAO|nr:Crp/Fnr family transcriptional regulator [Tenacibaculum maritimum]CAA0150417.1 putative transcriptional regulator, Crp/Fnr family [Tenacibaculum maritimum]CAA0176668.1 putative transcriptional regulator, Crp/Fnr family [Tenacibaculum maritimum]CAA0244726.1 putative transcriptional regulator, Crp/Fnr family [Tenacibaculum maritimum]SFZ82491.1 putative transcriptional regulator, Crp/Fnr family [Tenacibaculum maritimum NCIMB 2154]
MEEVNLLFDSLESNISIKREELELSRNLWRKKKFKKGEYFNEYGNICKYLGFIISGVFRTYYIDDELLEERNIFLHSDNDFFTAFKSLVNQTPCLYYIQSLTDSDIIYIHIDDLERLYSMSKGWERIGRIIAENSFNKLLYRTESLLFLKPEERYLNFVAQYKVLCERIPQYHIASFLGLKNQSISRIKKRLRIE